MNSVSNSFLLEAINEMVRMPTLFIRKQLKLDGMLPELQNEAL